MIGNTTTRGLPILCAALSIGLLSGRSEASDDPWPLVNAADFAVWGTLIHTSTGPSSRLIVVDGEDPPPPAAAIPPVRLVDHVVDLPDGTTVPPGGTGLYLATTADGRDPGFAEVAGTILTGGFIPGWPDSATRERVRRIAAPSEDAPFSEEDALALLASDWAPAKSLAIGWWRERAEAPSPAARTALAGAVRVEDRTACRLAIELHLARGWEVPTAGLVGRYLATEDPGLAHIALLAIAAGSAAEPRAELLLAWPSADREARARLLVAYADLAIEESLPWWQEAFASDDAELTTIAIRELGRARIPGAGDVYPALLASEDPRVVSLALQGLSRTGTPAATALLREFRAARPDDDPLGLEADRLLRQPRRYGARPPQPSPLESDGR